MTDDVEIDPATGMPKLPERDFWRVSPSKFADLKVEWVTRRPLTVWRETNRFPTGRWPNRATHIDETEFIESVVDDALILFATPAAVRRAAEGLVAKRSLLGNYPPNKLPGVDVPNDNEETK